MERVNCRKRFYCKIIVNDLLQHTIYVRRIYFYVPPTFHYEYSEAEE